MIPSKSSLKSIILWRKERRGLMRFQPFKVVIQLGSQLALNQRFPLSLESLLTYSVAGPSHRGTDLIPLPFIKETNGSYHASQMVAVVNSRDCWGQRLYVRQSSDANYRTSGEESKNPTGGPNQNSSTGDYRDRLEYLTVLNAEQLFFYGCGDIGEVRKYLKIFQTTGLGTRRNVGHGRVVSLTVTAIAKDLSLYDEQGNPARFLPVAHWPEPPLVRLDELPERPPYWCKDNLVMGYVPPMIPFKIIVQERDEDDEYE